MLVPLRMAASLQLPPQRWPTTAVEPEEEGWVTGVSHWWVMSIISLVDGGKVEDRCLCGQVTIKYMSTLATE